MDDNDNVADLAKYNLSIVNEWIRFADVKASIFLTLGLAILGASFANVSTSVKVAKYLYDNGMTYWLGGLLIGQVAFYIAIIYSVYRLAKVVRPRLFRKSDKHSWFYFGSMAQLSVDDFHKFTGKLTADVVITQLHDQIYNVSVIAKEKYEDVRCGVNALFVAILIGLLSIVPVLVLIPLLPVPK
jgi:hypothetical protein